MIYLCCSLSYLIISTMKISFVKAPCNQQTEIWCSYEAPSNTEDFADSFPSHAVTQERTFICLRCKSGINFLAHNPNCLSRFVLPSVSHSSHSRSVILALSSFVIAFCCSIVLNMLISQTFQVIDMTKLNSKKVFSAQIQMFSVWTKKRLAYEKLEPLLISKNISSSLTFLGLCLLQILKG